MAKPFAVDTNVLIYLHDNSAQEKRAIAKGLLADIPKIPLSGHFRIHQHLPEAAEI
ncbi:hypothetical protein [Parapedobacter sp. 2B3]|uniref:hypothetical protein n=1 Tax=Parapedobacter sp. 2B3 TaxID=3342381 RepID=UPI0035B5F924